MTENDRPTVGTRHIQSGGEFTAECLNCKHREEFYANGGESVGDYYRLHCPVCGRATHQKVVELTANRSGRIVK